MERLVLCTGNPGKVIEMRALLPREIEVLSLEEVGLSLDLPETGSTLESNAIQKARFAYDQCGLPCVADDTGLEVDALGGAPGVFSARYAGDGKDPIANMKKLLKELRRVTDRTARFRTVVALVWSGGARTFLGVAEGTIATEPYGRGGFGYDPLFRPSGSKRTFAEMGATSKNLIGHRGKAMRQLIAHLKGH